MKHKRLLDFIVIGAMKSATTTLHEQLAPLQHRAKRIRFLCYNI